MNGKIVMGFLAGVVATLLFSALFTGGMMRRGGMMRDGGTMQNQGHTDDSIHVGDTPSPQIFLLR